MDFTQTPLYIESCIGPHDTPVQLVQYEPKNVESEVVAACPLQDLVDACILRIRETNGLEFCTPRQVAILRKLLVAAESSGVVGLAFN